MKELVELLQDPLILLYLGALVAGQWIVSALRTQEEQERQARRDAAGLTDETLADPAAQLDRFRRWSGLQLIVLLAIGVGLPLVLLVLRGFDQLGGSNGLLLAFVTVIVFAIWGSTDVAKSWLGGVAFQALVAARRPFQLGDRVSLKGHSGRVVSIDAWHVKLQTFDDDLVSIPTASLWGETLVSTNAGDRSSLVVVEVRLAPRVTQDQRRLAEDFLWDAIQASSYLDPAKPMQIFVEQSGPAIILRGKAYVGSTYQEPLLRSDVVSAFLDYAAKHEIPLAER